MSDVETLIANRKYEAGFSTDIETEIVPAKLRNKAGIIGAALVATRAAHGA